VFYRNCKTGESQWTVPFATSSDTPERINKLSFEGHLDCLKRSQQSVMSNLITSILAKGGMIPDNVHTKAESKGGWKSSQSQPRALETTALIHTPPISTPQPHYIASSNTTLPTTLPTSYQLSTPRNTSSELLSPNTSNTPMTRNAGHSSEHRWQDMMNTPPIHRWNDMLSKTPSETILPVQSSGKIIPATHGWEILAGDDMHG
jgi:hypothetical protein